MWDSQVKGTAACLNFVMWSSLTWRTSCRRTGSGVKKTTTTGRWLSVKLQGAVILTFDNNHRTISCPSLKTEVSSLFQVTEVCLFNRLGDELLHCILKTVVRESCLLITKCQTVARDDFQKLLSTVPVRISAQQHEMPSVWWLRSHVLCTFYKPDRVFPSLQVVSPSLRYLMAVQNHLLSNTILIRPDDNDDSDSSLQGETMKVQVNIPFKYPFLCACGVCFACQPETNGAAGDEWVFYSAAL